MIAKETKKLVTCQSRKDVLELHKTMKNVSDITFLKFYEQDSVHVVIGWVPIPMSNERIKLAIETDFGPVIKVLQRKCKDGLTSGVRILIMEKKVLETYPMPSYLRIDGHELYVTYEGQNITCKYCGQAVH